jgi:hypothetical protein
MITLVLAASVLAGGQADPVVLRLERLTNCGGWKVAIHQSGRATGERFNACHAVKPREVKIDRSVAKDVPRLQMLVDRVRFRDLKERPQEANPILDDAVCVIEVAFRRPKHQVTVSGQQFSGRDAALESFRTIWRAVEKLMPEPEW